MLLREVKPNKFAEDGGLAGARAEADKWYRLYCEQEKEIKRLKKENESLRQSLSISRSGNFDVIDTILGDAY